MTNKEFAFKYAGDEFMFDGDRFILVGYESESPGVVILSPIESHRNELWYWEILDSTDVITYMTDIRKYQYANLNGLIPIRKEIPQTTPPEVRPKTPGDCIAYYEGQQGMNYSVGNGCLSAVYKRQGSALKLVSWGEGINNVAAKI